MIKIDGMQISIKFLKILAGILLLLIAWVWVQGIRVSMKASGPEKIEISEKPKVALKPPSALNIALFGEHIPDVISGDKVKKSTLKLSVVGILFASDEAKSHVMLALPDKTVHLFRVGDKVPGGAVIHKIKPDGILLLHNGVLESLNLPQDELLFSPPPAVLNLSN